jgi:hypothetical protein
MDYEQGQMIVQEHSMTQCILRQPHVYMRPKIYQDGDMWCALYGDDIQNGVCAFGETPILAMQNWDKVWHNGVNKTKGV